MSASPLTVPPVMTAGPVLHEPCVLLKLGEVVLKGRNRQRFERLLHENIRRSVKDLGVGIRVWQREGVIVLRTSPGSVVSPDSPGSSDTTGSASGPDTTGSPDRTCSADSTFSTTLSNSAASTTTRAPGGPGRLTADAAADLVAERMRLVMGLARVCRAVRVAKDTDAAAAAAIELMAGRTGSFAVRARRRDKRFPVTSAQIAVDLGERIRRAHGLTVNLSNPGTTVHVEVDQREIFVYTDGLPGQGGLPVGMSGRALVLVSGGIDSPVAAYRMMRRGLRCGYLHFSGMPLTGPESVYKAYGLVRQLDRFQGGSRLFVVAFGNAQRRLASSGAGRLQIMAQRRLMLKTGEALARRLGAAALITGDSLGQVSSQTLTNLTALDDAVSLPILRPLIGLDKLEIIAEARAIATLGISELRDEDCCSLLAPRQAETRARIADLRRIEARMEADDLAEELATAAQEHTPAWS